MNRSTRLLPLFASWLALLLTACGGGGGDSTTPDTTVPSEPVPVELPDSNTTTAYDAPLPLLVIRIAYSDRAFVSSAESWSDRFFGTSEHRLNHYMREVSKLIFSFAPAVEQHETRDDGVITVTLDHPHPDPDSSERQLIHADLSAAVAAAAPYIDFAAYDSDGNGAIAFDELQIIFIIAGYEDAYSGGTLAPGIWAHSWCVDPAPVADGVALLGCREAGFYSLFGERHAVSVNDSGHDATIGIIAHELGHAAFRLPDLYDTDGSSSGIGYFGLMAAGAWGRSGRTDLPGNTPTHPCAWSKVHNGWVTPQIVSGVNGAEVTLYQSASVSSNIVKVPLSGSEYFLLENRDNSGYDTGLYMLDGTFDGGLAVWHIDEEIIALKDATNTINNDESHKGVDLEEAADAQLDSGGNGHEGNLYYAGNADAFTPTTQPGSDSYAGSGSGIFIENISTRGAAMQATVTAP